MINKTYKIENQENKGAEPEMRDYCMCDIPNANASNVSFVAVPSSVMLVPYFQSSIADYQRVRFKLAND